MYRCTQYGSDSYPGMHTRTGHRLESESRTEPLHDTTRLDQPGNNARHTEYHLTPPIVRPQVCHTATQYTNLLQQSRILSWPDTRPTHRAPPLSPLPSFFKSFPTNIHVFNWFGSHDEARAAHFLLSIRSEQHSPVNPPASAISPRRTDNKLATGLRWRKATPTNFQHSPPRKTSVQATPWHTASPC